MAARRKLPPSYAATMDNTSSQSPEFIPPYLLRNAHRMTVAATFWPRRFPALPAPEPRLAEVAPDVRVRLDCHWQPDRTCCPTLLLVHGLEGSSDSHYILGAAEKAWRAGFNAVRMNVRNCGGTEHLTPSLYHSGLSADVDAVVQRLLADDLPEIHLAGFSMGGNMVLKLAGEWAAAAPRQIGSVSAVCPPVDLAGCADALHRPANRFYEWRFLFGLKSRLRRKARLFSRLYQTDGLRRVRSVRGFDDLFTAPHFGFGTAANYYAQASALPLLGRIALPTLILTAQDDPFVPFETFRDPALTGNPNITLLSPRFGGHVGFLAQGGATEDRFWAENRILDSVHRHPSPIGLPRASPG
jgi:predicted alpha/beta-fold hydrolase